MTQGHGMKSLYSDHSWRAFARRRPHSRRWAGNRPLARNAIAAGVVYALACTSGHAAAPARLSAAFYADTSCLISINESASIGRTLIDADIKDEASRTLIHCDTEDGQRLTLLARSDEIGTRGRFELLDHDAINEGKDGFIAWLTRAGASYVDETAPRRYVAHGIVVISETPTAQVAGSASNSSKQSFATIEGVLDPLLAHPDEGDK